MNPSTTTPSNENPAFERASKDVLSGLAIMYRECHSESPDSPLCAAIQDLTKAVSEVHSQKMSGQGAAPPATMDEAVAGLHQETMAGAPQPGGSY